MTIDQDDLAAAAQRLEELEAEVGRLQGALDAALTDLHAAQADNDALHGRLKKLSAQAAARAPAEQWNSPQQWVDGWLCRVVERMESSTTRWCRRWPEHPEAVLRIGLLHADFVKCTTSANVSMSNFVRNSLDYHLPLLLSATGPFAACTSSSHEPALHLATTQPPPQ